MEGRKIDKACRFALAQRASYHGDSNMHPDCTLVRGGGSRESAHHAGGFSDAKPSECCCVAYASAASLLECWNGAHITILAPDQGRKRNYLPDPASTCKH